MTLVNFKFGRPNPDGTITGAKGTIKAVPTRATVTVGAPDTTILPVPFTVTVPDSGEVVINLTPTQVGGWSWELTFTIAGVSAWTAYVLVPTTTSSTLDYPDLTQVDALSAQPTAAPDAIWWALLRDGLSSANPGPIGPRGVQGPKGADSTVPGPRGWQGIQGAKGETGDQGIQGPIGLTGATGAQGIQGTAGTNGTNGATGATGLTGAPWTVTPIANGANLDTFVTPGWYFVAGADAASIINSPRPGQGLAWDMRVTGRNSTIITQTIHLVNNGIQYTYQRTTVGTGFGIWRHYAPTRVFESAAIGRVGYVWDDINSREQLVYGDTGMRQIGAVGTLLNGWTAATAGDILLRREGSTVTLSAKINNTSATNDIFYNLPVGFRPRTQSSVPINGNTGNGTFRYARASWDGNVAIYRTTVEDLYIGGTWTTTDAWPATLPGTANGAIPNA
jgi:Collagen triple helix repeat (20 copies).